MEIKVLEPKLLLIHGANASKAAYSGLNPFNCLCLVPDEYLHTLAQYALRLGDTQSLLSSVSQDDYRYMLSFSGTPLDNDWKSERSQNHAARSSRDLRV